MVDVPTTNDMTNSGMDGLKTGGAAGLGQLVGRSILGRGVGTAAGGVLAGAMLDGRQRETVAALGVERGMNEVFAGASGNQSGGNRGRL